jgi:RNA polymerase sigma-70 factor, ECF subfamily
MIRAQRSRERSKVMELAYFGGFSHSEIAGMLQTHVGTLKGRIHLGLAKFRGQLGDVMEVPT